ncbi:NUDIX hydrolase [Paenibacillus contaminans]|uniref:DNA mismatch repair protein MutT n=1 Tax=Paenibacillus contaminans TaxID=450362 RepID=A0A329MT51_9BACL|nr:NUDIX domain-containing protein [Paenibacillus contaminans]RAV22994.1 DNA mismatch repair protein MutT [Paenibacillus contaminans]
MSKAEIVLVVSVSIIRDGKLLMVKENKPAVRNKWNFPGGRIEQGEHIFEAARREAKEETGYDIELTGTTGIYNFISDTNNQVIMFHFIGEIVGGILQIDGSEIMDCKWITASELLIPGLIELRDAGVIKQITNNLLNGKQYSLSLFHPQMNEDNGKVMGE